MNYIDYNQYILESLKKTISYSEYLSENIAMNISYSEYISSAIFSKKHDRMKKINKIFNEENS